MRPGHSFSEAEVAIEEVLREVKEHGISERELLKAKNSLEVNFWRQMSDTGNRATAIGDMAVTCGDLTPFFERIDALRSVSAEDVLRSHARSSWTSVSLAFWADR